MRKPGMRTALLAGGIAALAAAGWNVYSRRSIARIPGVEGLDDPEVAAGFEIVARLPPMQLMRWGVAARATAMQPRGLAVDLGCGLRYLHPWVDEGTPGFHEPTTLESS